MQWADRIGSRLKLRDLHVLMTVVRAGTMAKAARLLAVSQPVVSKTISDLEHTLGVKLLDRSRNGIEPTLYGRALLKHGTAVFDELRQSVEEIKFLSDPTIGELRIGCSDAVAAGLLPAIISRIHRHHPRIAFDARGGVGAELHRLLRERTVELIIGRTATPLAEPDLRTELLMDDPIVVVAGSQSPWLRRRKMVLADLVDEPWILPPPDSVTGAVIGETFRTCGLALPRPVTTITSLQLMIALLGNGNYLAMWPVSVLQFGARNLPVRVLPIKLPALPRPVGIISLSGRTISPLAQLFIEYTRKMAKPTGD
jgi:DNA-binding transcriptional LysR family regulator